MGRKFDWSDVDWEEDNSTIARKVGTTPRAVRIQRSRIKAGPAIRHSRDRYDEQRWARFLADLRSTTEDSLTFFMEDAKRAWRRPNDSSEQRLYERTRRRIYTMKRHGLVRDLGRKRKNCRAYVMTLKARLLLKAHDTGDRSEWDALTNRREDYRERNERRRKRSLS